MENDERQKVQSRKPFGYDLEMHWATDQTTNDIYSPLSTQGVTNISIILKVEVRDFDDLNICEVQNGLLIRNHIKLHRFPDSVAKQIAPLSFSGWWLWGTSLQKQKKQTNKQTCVMVIKSIRHTINIPEKSEHHNNIEPTSHQANSSHDSTNGPGYAWWGDVLNTLKGKKH